MSACHFNRSHFFHKYVLLDLYKKKKNERQMFMGGSKEQLCELCTQQSDKDICEFQPVHAFSMVINKRAWGHV